MKIKFVSPINHYKYELVDSQEVVSIGNTALNISIADDFSFTILFNVDTLKTKATRKFGLAEDKLTITLYNFNANLGHFFPDIVDLDNGYSLHISSKINKESDIRNTKIFCYKYIEPTYVQQ